MRIFLARRQSHTQETNRFPRAASTNQHTPNTLEPTTTESHTYYRTHTHILAAHRHTFRHNHRHKHWREHAHTHTHTRTHMQLFHDTHETQFFTHMQNRTLAPHHKHPTYKLMLHRIMKQMQQPSALTHMATKLCSLLISSIPVCKHFTPLRY